MSRSFTLSGQAGTIPYDEYLRKIQHTDLKEDPDQYEKYLRKQLVDFRPDDPFFESDQTRDPNDRGSGFGSRERLSLRYSGARSEEDPYLPDGTFLDHEFMERDPRGTQNLPDFAGNGRRQQMARAGLIKFYNDDDHSVPETGINPVQMVSLIRGAQQQFKDRWRNFEESMDSWHNGSAALRGDRSTVAMVTQDGTIVNLADATAEQRQDPVNLLSNRTPALLRSSAPDHRVKISKYGQIKPVMDMNSNEWNTNRYNSYLDHQIPIEVNGQLVNRGLAMLILDLEGQRATKQVVAHGTDYDDSHGNLLREMQQKINPEDLYKMIMIGMTSHSQDKTAHEEFYDGAMMVRNSKFKGDVRKLLNAGEINHDIANSMMQSNRAVNKKQRSDLREEIHTSAADHGLYQTNKNRPASVRHTRNTLVRESLDTRMIETQRETKTYGAIKPAENYNPHEKLDFEKYAQSSKTTQHRKMNARKMKNRSVNDTVDDVDMGEFALPGARHVRDSSTYMGRKTTSDYGDMLRHDSDDAASLHDTLYQMVLSK
jgi:hypothetical protein